MKNLSSNHRQALSSVDKMLSSTSIDDLTPAHINDIIGTVHGVLESWCGERAVADAMLQTVGVDVTVIQIHDDRKSVDSSAHQDLYDDQRKFDPRSAVEAARLGLRHLVHKLLDTGQTDPTKTLCELVNERWDREYLLWEVLYFAHEAFLDRECDVMSQKQQENLRTALRPLTNRFSVLAWEKL